MQPIVTKQEQALREAIEALDIDGVVVWPVHADSTHFDLGLRFGVSLPWPSGPDVGELTSTIRSTTENVAASLSRVSLGFGPDWGNAGGVPVVYIGFQN